MPKSTRDNQRQRLYDAEMCCHTWQQTIPTADLQSWVDDLMAYPAVQSRWGYGPTGDPRRTKALATARTLEAVMG